MNDASLPSAPRGSPLDGVRRRFFYSPGASIVTVAVAALLGWAGWAALDWTLFRAVPQPD